MKLLPRSMTYSTPFNNHGNFIISLGQLTPWLAQKAESLGVEVFPGFAAAAAVFDEDGAVKGVRIGDMGAGQGRHSPGRTSRRASEIHARPHGAGGRLPRLGFQAADRQVRPRARVTVRRPSRSATRSCGSCRRARAAGAHRARARLAGGSHTYAGSFLYHLDNDRVYVGYIVGLDYAGSRACSRSRPSSSTRTIRRVKPLLEGGEILSAGARTIAAGRLAVDCRPLRCPARS